MEAGAVRATLACWYMVTQNERGAHTIELDGSAVRFAFTPTAAAPAAALPPGKALPTRGVPVRNAYLGSGAYVAVCGGIGDTVHRGRGTAWVLSNEAGQPHIVVGEGEQKLVIFKSSNVDFNQVDGTTLAVDGDGKLQIAAAGITPNKVAPSFVSWLDAKISAVPGGGGGGDVVAQTASISERNRLEVADRSRYVYFTGTGGLGDAAKSTRVTAEVAAAIRSSAGGAVGVVIESGEFQTMSDQANPLNELRPAFGSGIISGVDEFNQGCLEIRKTSMQPGEFGFSTPAPPGSSDVGFTAYDTSIVAPAQDWFVPTNIYTVATLGDDGSLALRDANGALHTFVGGQYRVRTRHAGLTVYADAAGGGGIVSTLFGQDGKVYMPELVVSGDIRAEQLELTSDIRRKTDIEVQNGDDILHRLDSIQSLTYQLASRGGDGRRFRGVSAQDVREVFPEMVSAAPDGSLSVDYAGLCSALVGGLNSLHSRVEALECNGGGVPLPVM